MKYTFNNLVESNKDSENYGKPISVNITFRQWLVIKFKDVKNMKRYYIKLLSRYIKN